MLPILIIAVAAISAGFVLLFFVPRLLETATDHPAMLAVATLLRAVGWVITVFGFVVFFGFNLLGLVVVVGAIVITVIQRRFAEQDALLWILALCARRQMPLLPAVDAYAQQCHGLYRRKVRKLAESLAGGMPLAESVVRLRGLLPASGVAAAAVGAVTGTLARALEDEATSRARHRGVWHNTILRVAYLVFVMCVLAFMTSGMMIWIVPEFVKIFQDFEADLPVLTQIVMATSYAIVNHGLLILLGLMAFAALVFGVPYLWSGSAAAVPIVGRIIRRRHGAAVLRALALVAESGRPLETGLRVLGRTYPTASIWPRIQKVETAVAGGASCWGSLSHEGLIGAGDVAVLEAAQRVGNLPWALREMAERAERRISYRVQGWSQVLFPLAMMAVAMLIAILVIGLMLPLISLIEKLS